MRCLVRLTRWRGSNHNPTYTRITVKPNFRAGFSSDFPKSIPEGLFLPNLDRSTILRSVSAKLWLVETDTKVVEWPWVMNVDKKKKVIDIPTIVKDVSHLKNYPGINFIVHFDSKNVPRMLQRLQVVEFSVDIEFKDEGFKNLINRYTDGLIAVHPFLSASEQRLLGIGKRKLGVHDLPGSFIELQENPNRVEYLEYTWRPELVGEFMSPDNMVGAKQFWDSGYGRNHLDGSFVFKASGPKWFSYIAAIVGLPILMAGITLAKLSSSQLKRSSKKGILRRGA